MIDEPVSPRVAGILRQAGHDVVHAREIGLTASPDAAILDNLERIQTALREGALVVLSDGAIRIRHLPVR